ncbi:dihydrofolate reductase [Halopenitus persicus]|uniref:dihydrofolate reductase n=1 Tax=Halopenitus persicus TaxID=1048396 RepID=UPI000BBB050E|nr:dihydrofolate reductase [Halopenitus persicus]
MGDTTAGQANDPTDVDAPSNGDVPDGLTVSLIAAVAENGVIGDSGGMPWHYPADLEHFKSTTTGHPVILGRRTYESIAAELGGPLPDRVSIVLSRSDLDLPDGAVGADGIDDALDRAAAAAAELGVATVYVAGGATIYEAFLPLADELVLTEIHESYAGDTRFPEWDADEWTETDRNERDELTFRTYRRR